MTRFHGNILVGLLAVILAIPSLGEEVTRTEHRGSYTVNGRIHVGLFGHPDGPCLLGFCKRMLAFALFFGGLPGWGLSLIWGGGGLRLLRGRFLVCYFSQLINFCWCCSSG